MIIAVDFDGTLFEKRVPYDGRVGKPILDIINVVKLAKRLRHNIMIFTCRSAKKNGRKYAINALKKYNIPYDAFNKEVVNNCDGVYFDIKSVTKPAFDLLIDDKAAGWLGPKLIGKILRKQLNG